MIGVRLRFQCVCVWLGFINLTRKRTAYERIVLHIIKCIKQKYSLEIRSSCGSLSVCSKPPSPGGWLSVRMWTMHWRPIQLPCDNYVKIHTHFFPPQPVYTSSQYIMHTYIVKYFLLCAIIIASNVRPMGIRNTKQLNCGRHHETLLIIMIMHSSINAFFHVI